VTTFPLTRPSAIRRTASTDDAVREAANQTVAQVYWPPICAYIRIAHRYPREDAEDLTQGFFADALRRDLFARYEPARARFRTYVRLCVDRFVANARKADGRLKRGGGSASIALDDAPQRESLAIDPAADRLFHEEWVRSVLDVSVTRLRERSHTPSRQRQFALFERYDLEGTRTGAPPSYAALAAEFGLSVSQVTNGLASIRAEFRAVVLEVLHELTGNDEEFREEARSLLGITPP
jgi:hypothetical protein